MQNFKECTMEHSKTFITLGNQHTTSWKTQAAHSSEEYFVKRSQEKDHRRTNYSPKEPTLNKPIYCFVVQLSNNEVVQ